MSGDPQDRLRAHVEAILSQSGVPARDRDELAEELYGHLFDRWRALVGEGIADREAVDRAVSDFGTPDELGGQLRRTYHSRLWASTVGVVLPAVAGPSSRPGTVAWLRFVLGLVAVLASLGVIALPSLTPFRLIGSTASIILAMAGAILAFIALGRGQRWALIYAVGVCGVLLIEGLVDAISKTGPSNLTIPVGSILATFVLLSARRHWSELQAFVASSARLRGGLAFLLAAALVAPPVVPRVLAALPDPTASGPEDLDLRLEMTCDRGDDNQRDAPPITNTKRATVVVDATWTKTDLLPLGIGGLLGGDDADTSGLRVIGPIRPELPAWLWADGPTIVDLATGEPVGWWGSTSAGWAFLPEDVIGTLTVAIDGEDLHAGHTIRTTWVLIPATDAEPAWPEVEVFYAHLDRFALAGTVGCNGISHGAVIDAQPAPIVDDGPFPF